MHLVHTGYIYIQFKDLGQKCHVLVSPQNLLFAQNSVVSLKAGLKIEISFK